MDTTYPWLMLGDCLERMKEIPDGSVDMILCDLPYGTTACKWDSIIPFEPLWEQYWRVVKDNAAIALFAQQPFSTLLVASQISHFKFDFVWVKNTQTGIALAKYQPMRKHELINVFYKRQPVFNKQPNKSQSTIVLNHVKSGYARGKIKYESQHFPTMMCNRDPFTADINPATVLNFNIVNNRDKSRCHPTQKPVALLEYLIRTYTHEDETVLDNTMGSGSTGVACVNTNRKFIGIEKDEKYFRIAQSRIQSAIDEKSQLLFSDVS
jgi:DNA modification methylase